MVSILLRIILITNIKIDMTWFTCWMKQHMWRTSRPIYWWWCFQQKIQVKAKYYKNAWAMWHSQGRVCEGGREYAEGREGEITRSAELLGLIPPCSGTLNATLYRTPLATQLYSQISAKLPPATLDREGTAAERNVVGIGNVVGGAHSWRKARIWKYYTTPVR